MVGVLPTNVRPFKHIDSRLPDDDSVTVWGMVPACVQVTVPPGAMVTATGSNRGLPGVSRIVTAADAGPPADTMTCPLIGCRDRKSTRMNSSHRTISYAVFCL